MNDFSLPTIAAPTPNASVPSSPARAVPVHTPPPLSLVPSKHQSAKAEERPQLCRLSDLLGAWENDAQSAFQARTSGVPRGPITGLEALDRELGGCFAPGVHIAHGQPGAGKTAFALQVAASCGCPCLYLSCEMAPLELLRRVTARLTNTFLGRLKSGELRLADSLELARRAVSQVTQLALVDGTRAYASPGYLRECAEIVRGDAPHLLLIVDSLHAWTETAPSTGATEYDTLNVALVALKRMAAELGCPILAIAERNRGSMQGGGMSAGAGTRKIEYGAETVIDLERGEGVRADQNGEVEVKAKLCKNRHGAAGKAVCLKFHGALQRFQEAQLSG